MWTPPKNCWGSPDSMTGRGNGIPFPRFSTFGRTALPLSGDGRQRIPQLVENRGYETQLVIIELVRNRHRQSIDRSGEGQGAAVWIFHVITWKSIWGIVKKVRRSYGFPARVFREALSLCAILRVPLRNLPDRAGNPAYRMPPEIAAAPVRQQIQRTSSIIADMSGIMKAVERGCMAAAISVRTPRRFV